MVQFIEDHPNVTITFRSERDDKDRPLTEITMQDDDIGGRVSAEVTNECIRDAASNVVLQTLRQLLDKLR